MLAAAATEFTEFQAVRRGLLILGRHVVPTLACLTLKHNIIAWHRRKILVCDLNRSCGIERSDKTYSTTSETVPAPTVRPPSRIAKRNPFSIAMGAINSISIATLSPGITISTAAGECATPVTSVVRK